ncbi:hypothetical protein WG66_003152 [Moniliophthora roreri]|nr:hypothetical protein WG66_003152 [Moniliophthora roreri]
MPVSSPFRFRRRHCVGLPNINITNIHQQAPLDIKPPSSRALCPAIPVSLSGIIAGMPAENLRRACYAGIDDLNQPEMTLCQNLNLS